MSETLPWYHSDTATRVTLSRLLNHTSGLPDAGGGPAYYERSLNMQDIRAIVENHRSGDLISEPNRSFRCNNADHLILQVVLEVVSGQDFAALLSSRTLAPLALHGTGL